MTTNHNTLYLQFIFPNSAYTFNPVFCRYSNLLDLPGVSLNPDVPGGVKINPQTLPHGNSSWVNHDTVNPQDRR